MPALLLKELPRFECLLEAARHNPELDPSAVVAYLHLLRAGDEAFAAADRNFARFELSHGRFGVLMLLWRKAQHGNECSPSAVEGRTPADLAAAAGVSRATMTGLLDTLERDGLVVRQPDQQDRRMMLVQMTDRGRTVLAGLLPLHFQTVAELFSPLSESERQTLVQLLARLCPPFRSAPEPESPEISIDSNTPVSVSPHVLS
jgi:DNA-binding MarR family transcriptional regulator